MNLMHSVLETLTARDREILTRFYFNEGAPEAICREMNLTETQFRLIKSRAKAKFGELGRRKLEQDAFDCRVRYLGQSSDAGYVLSAG